MSTERKAIYSVCAFTFLALALSLVMQGGAPAICGFLYGVGFTCSWGWALRGNE